MRIRTLVALTLVVAIAAYLLGPRVEIDESVSEPTIPADVERWVAEKESVHSDMVVGSEKRIIWANNAGQRTERVFVYLHGFSASRQETAPLMDSLSKTLGANVFETRLTGHGRSEQAMTEASVNAWLNDAVEALAVAEKLGDKVTLVGTSTGSTLAWWLAAHATDRVDQLVLISPNFKVNASGTALLSGPWGEQISELLMGEARCFDTQNAQQAKYWTECYPIRALQPMLGLLKLADGVSASDISQPVLAVYSPDDKVVDAEYTQQRLAQLPSGQLTVVHPQGVNDPKQHVLAGDILSPDTTASVAEVIVGFVSAQRAVK